jgi:hypothetical protein
MYVSPVRPAGEQEEPGYRDLFHYFAITGDERSVTTAAQKVIDSSSFVEIVEGAVGETEDSLLGSDQHVLAAVSEARVQGQAWLILRVRLQ